MMFAATATLLLTILFQFGDISCVIASNLNPDPSVLTNLPESVALPESNTDHKEAKKQPPKMRGFLFDKISLRSYLSFSNLNKSVAKKFMPFIIPVTTTSIGRVSGYIAMAHVASSTLGTFDMAAHQIVTSIFFCLAPFVDALGQVAQSFVPAVFEVKEKSIERAKALRKIVNNFRKVGAMFSALLVTLTACIPLMSRYFTADPIVLQRVNGAIPGVGLFLLVNGLMTVGEGSSTYCTSKFSRLWC